LKLRKIHASPRNKGRNRGTGGNQKGKKLTKKDLLEGRVYYVRNVRKGWLITKRRNWIRKEGLRERLKKNLRKKKRVL